METSPNQKRRWAQSWRKCLLLSIRLKNRKSYFAQITDVGIYGPRDELYIRMDWFSPFNTSFQSTIKFLELIERKCRTIEIKNFDRAEVRTTSWARPIRNQRNPVQNTFAFTTNTLSQWLFHVWISFNFC